MKVFVNTEVEITEDNPYENDLFDRKEFGDSLLNIIQSNKEVKLVFSIDSKWGDGKTTFVKMWKKHIEKESIPCVYFDAFKHDFYNDPFLAISREIYKFYVDNNLKTSEESFQDAFKKAFNFLFPIATDVAESMLPISKAVTKPIENTISKKLKLKEDELDALKKIIENTSPNYYEKLSSKNEHPPQNEYPFIIIIDELDRCRPSYTISLLEKIKHIFSTKNVVFVLMINKEQIENSIKHIYGKEIDANLYLQKFFHFNIALPKKIEGLSRMSQDDIIKYCKHLYTLHDVENFIKEKENIYEDIMANWHNRGVTGNKVNHNLQLYIPIIAYFFQFSYRETELFFRNIAMYLERAYSHTKTLKAYNISPLYIWLIGLKIKHHSLFEKILVGTLKFENLSKELKGAIIPINRVYKENEQGNSPAEFNRNYYYSIKVLQFYLDPKDPKDPSLQECTLYKKVYEDLYYDYCNDIIDLQLLVKNTLKELAIFINSIKF